jgi:hypothetical protein
MIEVLQQPVESALTTVIGVMYQPLVAYSCDVGTL